MMKNKNGANHKFKTIKKMNFNKSNVFTLYFKGFTTSHQKYFIFFFIIIIGIVFFYIYYIFKIKIKKMLRKHGYILSVTSL